MTAFILVTDSALETVLAGRGDSSLSVEQARHGPGSQPAGRIRPYCCSLQGPSAAHPTLQAVVAGVKDPWKSKAESGQLQDKQ